jgi:uncharacterized membrane protein
VNIAMPLLIALGLGVVCGLRTLAVPAVLSLFFHSLGWRILFIAGAAIELVGDVLPSTPSRLRPAGLLFRCISGGASAAFLTSALLHEQSNLVAAATALGIVGALAGAFGGAAYRKAVAKGKLPDWPFALLEDVIAFGLAFVLVSLGNGFAAR